MDKEGSSDMHAFIVPASLHKSSRKDTINTIKHVSISHFISKLKQEWNYIWSLTSLFQAPK